MMVSSGLTKEQVLDPDVEVAFPESVVQMMRGDLGRPEGGWPEGIQKKVLKDAEAARATRPGAPLPPLDLAAERKKLDEKLGRAATDTQFASYLMYPKVFLDYAQRPRDVRRLRHPADAGVLLRHGAGRGGQRRHRARQDAHRAFRRAVRSARRRHAPGVLRAERPAAFHRRDRSLAGREAAAAAQDGAGQCQACRRADAGHHRDRESHRRPEGRARATCCSRWKP